jgi:2-dehydro-3-deoxyphosphogluconate aldolase/(4S)-4-hydroxy-2-oxoglutarate aldolase
MNSHQSAGPVSRPAIPPAISQGRVIAIGRHLDIASVLAIGEALATSGIHAFELTMNSASAVEAIAALTARFAPEELLVGAGTVLEESQAQAAVDAGARFLVMPNFDPWIVGWAVRHEVPVFPGAFTPTEILAAWRVGASAVKLFPASAVGPTFLRELRGPLPQIPLIPTGGVTVENAPAFIAAGALAVGMGSWLTGGGDPAVIRERASAVVAALAVSR